MFMWRLHVTFQLFVPSRYIPHATKDRMMLSHQLTNSTRYTTLPYPTEFRELFTCPPILPDGKPYPFVWLRAMRVGSTSTLHWLKGIRKTYHLTGPSTKQANTRSNSCNNIPANIDFYPSEYQHVGFMPCSFDHLRRVSGSRNIYRILFVVREPLERLLSAVTHGIDYGVARKYAFRCRGGGRQEGEMLDNFLVRCPGPFDNHLLQMLDPETMNIDVALQRLRQPNMVIGFDKSLDATTCMFAQAICAGSVWCTPVKHINAAVIRNEPKRFSTDTLFLQHLIANFTRNDEIIYREALKLHALQMLAFQNTTHRTNKKSE